MTSFPRAFLLLAALHAGCRGSRGDAVDDAVPVSVRGRGGERDTGRTLPPRSVRIFGRVLVSSHYGAGVADSLPAGFVAHSPVAGATVRAIRNALVNGAASQSIVAEARADSAGRYEFPPLPGSYYLVSATAPAGSPLRGFPEPVPLTRLAQVDIYLGLPRQYDVDRDTSSDWNLDLRLAALAAFREARAPLEARWRHHTVEGQPILFRLHASTGRIEITEDHRADGGEIREYAFTRVDLVRVVPSVWVNSRELEKGYLEIAQPSTARPTRGGYRLGMNCSGRSCERLY